MMEMLPRDGQTPLLCSSPNLRAQVGKLGCRGEQPWLYPATMLKPESSSDQSTFPALAQAGGHKRSRHSPAPGLKSVSVGGCNTALPPGWG